jgi:hypothetical protein
MVYERPCTAEEALALYIFKGLSDVNKPNKSM